MILSFAFLALLQLSTGDVRKLAPKAEGERWPSVEIRAAAPVPVWAEMGFQSGDKIQVFNGHAMDVTTAEVFYAWSVSPATSAGIVMRRGGKLKWFQHRVGRAEEPRLRPAMNGKEMLGIEVVSVPPSAFWAGIGLRAGDVIVSVNGLALNSPLALLSAFSSPDQKLRIRRGKEEFELEWPRTGGAPDAVTTPPSAPPASTGQMHR